MKTTVRSLGVMLAMTCLTLPGSGQEAVDATSLGVAGAKAKVGSERGGHPES